MATTITRDVLESYLKCRYKGHLILAGERGVPADYELLMREARERVRQNATDLLLARHKGDKVLRGLSVTPALLSQGASLILEATVEGPGLSVCFDALRRIDGRSSLGDFHYVPVLFHEAERPAREQRTLLAILGLILGPVQGKEPGWGILIHGRELRDPQDQAGNRGQTGPADLARNRGGTGDRHAAETVAEPPLPGLRVPPAMSRGGDGERRPEFAAGHGREGDRQVRADGASSPSPSSPAPSGPRKKHKTSNQKGQPHHHALQALAIREKKVYVLGTPGLPLARRGSTSISRATRNGASTTCWG